MPATKCLVFEEFKVIDFIINSLDCYKLIKDQYE